MSREQKEAELIAALNKSTGEAQAFFLNHMIMVTPGSGKIRDMLMRMDNETFEIFYDEEIDNLTPREEDE